MLQFATFVITFRDKKGLWQLRVVHDRSCERAIASARGSMPNPTLEVEECRQYDHATIGTLIGFHYRPA